GSASSRRRVGASRGRTWKPCACSAKCATWPAGTAIASQPGGSSGACRPPCCAGRNTAAVATSAARKTETQFMDRDSWLLSRAVMPVLAWKQPPHGRDGATTDQGSGRTARTGRAKIPSAARSQEGHGSRRARALAWLSYTLKLFENADPPRMRPPEPPVSTLPATGAPRRLPALVDERAV